MMIMISNQFLLPIFKLAENTGRAYHMIPYQNKVTRPGITLLTLHPLYPLTLIALYWPRYSDDAEALNFLNNGANAHFEAGAVQDAWYPI